MHAYLGSIKVRWAHILLDWQQQRRIPKVLHQLLQPSGTVLPTSALCIMHLISYCRLHERFGGNAERQSVCVCFVCTCACNLCGYLRVCWATACMHRLCARLDRACAVLMIGIMGKGTYSHRECQIRRKNMQVYTHAHLGHTMCTCAQALSIRTWHAAL